MIKSKEIKVLCYIATGISYILSLGLIAYGIYELTEEKTVQGLIKLLIGILVPLLVNISMYPIWALSQIECHTSDLNDKLEKIIILKTLESTSQSTTIPSQKNTPTDRAQSNSSATTGNNADALNEAIDFINREYNIQIESTDDLKDIKEKISNIDAIDNSTQIFKERIDNATSVRQMFAIIKLHYTIRSVNKK